MSRGGRAGVTFALAALALLLLAAAAVPAAPTDSASPPARPFAAVGQITPDTVLLDVALQPNGDAHWSIRYRVRLDNENTTAAFDSLQQDVERNRSAYEARFRERIGGTVSAAENATGRQMTVENVSVRTSRQEIPQRYGVLTYSFTWTGFAATDGSQIRAGDAIGGLFLDDQTSLTVHWPSGYHVVSTDPEPTDSGDQSVTWRGSADFTTDQPRVVVSSAPTTPASNDSGGGLSTTTLAVVALLALAVVVGGAWWWRRGERASPAPGGAPPPSDGAAATETGPPEELLSNEERVLRLLREHGGRMKQQQVVQELGWTDAKTSQVVGDLRDAGKIEGFRLGRENVLDLPEDDEASES